MIIIGIFYLNLDTLIGSQCSSDRIDCLSESCKCSLSKPCLTRANTCEATSPPFSENIQCSTLEVSDESNKLMPVYQHSDGMIRYTIDGSQRQGVWEDVVAFESSSCSGEASNGIVKIQIEFPTLDTDNDGYSDCADPCPE